MDEKKKIFDGDDYKYISNFVEQKLPILRQNKNFNDKYLKLADMTESLEKL